MRYVTVRVVDGGGRPQSGVKVTIWVYQTFAVTGHIDPQYTDSNGETEFRLDDGYNEISISVKDHERVKRDKVQAYYKIIL